VKLLLTERFQKDVLRLSPVERARTFEALLKVPAAVKDAHRHTGMGLRKLHRSGIYEARIGLGLRLIFALRGGDLVLATLGSHDHVRKYLASL